MIKIHGPFGSLKLPPTYKETSNQCHSMIWYISCVSIWSRWYDCLSTLRWWRRLWSFSWANKNINGTPSSAALRLRSCWAAPGCCSGSGWQSPTWRRRRWPAKTYERINCFDTTSTTKKGFVQTLTQGLGFIRIYPYWPQVKAMLRKWWCESCNWNPNSREKPWLTPWFSQLGRSKQHGAREAQWPAGLLSDVLHVHGEQGESQPRTWMFWGGQLGMDLSLENVSWTRENEI